MSDREKVINALNICRSVLSHDDCNGCPYRNNYVVFARRDCGKTNCESRLMADALALLKEQKNEYENGFNDAMLGKQELMYEGTDEKRHKKDW